MIMKKILFLLFLLNIIVAKGQNVVTKFTSSGDFAVNPSYVKPFNEGINLESYKNLDPSILKDEMKINTPSGTSYIVKAFRFKDWENDPGDYHVVEIYKDENKIYEMLSIDGWNYFPKQLTNETINRCCYPVNINDDTVALVFDGVSYPYEYGLVGIVILNSNLAKLVFNKRFKIRELKKTDEEVKFVMQENIVEYFSSGNKAIPNSEPILKTLSISKDCISLN